MLSDWTSGRPALIIVANWRVKITTSRVLIPLPNVGSLIALGASRTVTGVIRPFRRKAITSSRVGTSSCPFISWPLATALAVYSNIGIAWSSLGPLVLAPRRRGHLVHGLDRLLLHRLLPDHPQELVPVARHPEALLLRDEALDVGLVEGVGHRLHPELLAGLERAVDLVDL